jgi:hypothetical protein
MPEMFDRRGKFLIILIRAREITRDSISLSFVRSISARAYQDHQESSAVAIGAADA